MSGYYQDNQEETQPSPDAIRVDGFAQILEMLQIADPAFRESLLRRLAAKDKNLVARLKRELELST